MLMRGSTHVQGSSKKGVRLVELCIFLVMWESAVVMLCLVELDEVDVGLVIFAVGKM